MEITDNEVEGKNDVVFFRGIINIVTHCTSKTYTVKDRLTDGQTGRQTARHTHKHTHSTNIKNIKPSTIKQWLALSMQVRSVLNPMSPEILQS